MFRIFYIYYYYYNIITIVIIIIIIVIIIVIIIIIINLVSTLCSTLHFTYREYSSFRLANTVWDRFWIALKDKSLQNYTMQYVKVKYMKILNQRNPNYRPKFMISRSITAVRVIMSNGKSVGCESPFCFHSHTVDTIKSHNRAQRL